MSRSASGLLVTVLTTFSLYDGEANFLHREHRGLINSMIRLPRKVAPDSKPLRRPFTRQERRRTSAVEPATTQRQCSQALKAAQRSSGGQPTALLLLTGAHVAHL
jgi:hypothetical protein